MLTLLLLSAGQGLLLSFGLMSTIRKKGTSNFFLGLITLVISLEILTFWAVRMGYTARPDRFPFWVFSSYLILPAATFLLGKINTRSSFVLKRWHIVLFLPALTEIAVELFTDYSNARLGTNYQLMQNKFWYAYTELLPTIAMVLVLLIFWSDIAKLVKRVKKLTIRSAHVTKVLVLNSILTLITVLWILDAFTLLPIFNILVFLLCLLVFVIGYLAFYDPDFLQPPAFLDRSASREEDEDDLARIKTLFEQDKIFMQPKLSIKETAKQLRITPRRLSELINAYHQEDFRKFVNRYRIQEVVQKVEEGQLENKTLLALALEAGFNSKSSFNQSFKDTTGHSPSQFFSKRNK